MCRSRVQRLVVIWQRSSISSIFSRVIRDLRIMVPRKGYFSVPLALSKATFRSRVGMILCISYSRWNDSFCIALSPFHHMPSSFHWKILLAVFHCWWAYSLECHYHYHPRVCPAALPMLHVIYRFQIYSFHRSSVAPVRSSHHTRIRRNPCFCIDPIWSGSQLLSIEP